MYQYQVNWTDFRKGQTIPGVEGQTEPTPEVGSKRDQ